MQKDTKILVINTGGTWCMTTKLETGYRVPAQTGDQFDLVGRIPMLQSLCDLSAIELFSRDSSNFTPHQWHLIAEAVVNHYAKFDGFVVLTGTDTLQFTAAALAFALQGTQKPVVVTGAQLPLDQPGSDAATNIINSVRLACLRQGCRENSACVQEVVVVFGSKIMRATRCHKVSENRLEAFDSVNFPTLGRFGIHLELDDHLLLKHRLPFRPETRFNPDVTLVYLYPGIKPGYLLQVGEQSAGLVIAAYGAGNVPTCQEGGFLSLIPTLEKLNQRGKPVVLTTRCITGQTEPHLYETGFYAGQAGAISAGDTSPDTAFVKLSWLLGPKNGQDRTSAAVDLNWLCSQVLASLCGERQPAESASQMTPVRETACRRTISSINHRQGSFENWQPGDPFRRGNRCIVTRSLEKVRSFDAQMGFRPISVGRHSHVS